MPASIMDCFPSLASSLNAVQFPLTASVTASNFFLRSTNLAFDFTARAMGAGFDWTRIMAAMPGVCFGEETRQWVGTA